MRTSSSSDSGGRKVRWGGAQFAGWRVVTVAALAMGMTSPGQTIGVSVFVDPMLTDLQLTRSEVSAAYLVGTLVSALAMPALGRLIDDRGTRIAMALIACAFGAVLAGMTAVVGLVSLAIGFTGIRMFGQGGLTLVATTAPAPWFHRHRGLAIGVTSAVGSALMSIIPLLSGALILRFGWRSTWLMLALAVWVIVLPLALRGIVNRPEDIGQRVDGFRPASDSAGEMPAGKHFTRKEALRTPIFWVISAAVATTSAIGTGLTFHQIDLLGEQGLTALQAAANFLPQTGAALGATLLVGNMIDRLSSRWVLLVAMSLLVLAMAGVSFVRPGLLAITYGILVGSAGAATRTLEAAAFPRLFGLRHLGAIRGAVKLIAVSSSAFGPLLLSMGRDLTGSYQQVLLVLLSLPVAIAILGLLVSVPAERVVGTGP